MRYVVKEDSSHAVRMVSAVGRRLPTYCTAVGMMLLPTLSDAALAERCADRAMPMAVTPGSTTTPDHQRQELGKIRSWGLAFDDCKSNLDVRCAAAPIFGHTGDLVAAMSTWVPVTRMGWMRRAELTDLVRRGAEDRSRRLGGSVASRAASR